VDDLQRELADPQLAVDLLSTLRHNGDELEDHLQDPERASAWLTAHFGPRLGRRLSERANVDDLVRFRDRLRTLFTAVVDGRAAPLTAIQAINEAAAEAPVTLAARRARDGTVRVERTHLDATAVSVLRAECARAALALLTDDLRDRLMLCRAPSCILFFLRQHPHQQWCSPSCGNRARVARHYARHHHQQSR